MRWFDPESAGLAYPIAAEPPGFPPLRILFAGDFNWFSGRERHTANLKLFDLTTKLSNAAVRANHTLVTFSDRAIFRQGRRLGSKAAGVRQVTHRFLQAVDELRPEAILLHFADHIGNDALLQARRLSPGVRIAVLNVDPLSDPENRRRLAARRDAVDGCFVTTAGPMLRQLAGRRSFVSFMPNPADRSVEAGCAFRHDAAEIDLLFPTTDDDPRALGLARIRPSQALADIRARIPGVRIASPGLEQPKAKGISYFEAIRQARLGWSLSRYNGEYLYASARMVHMMASGIPALIDRRSGLDRFFAEEEAVFYTDFDELLAQIRRMLADDGLRRHVARAGWRKTWALFDSGRVLDYVLAQLFDLPGAQAYEWPSERWRAGWPSEGRRHLLALSGQSGWAERGRKLA